MNRVGLKSLYNFSNDAIDGFIHFPRSLNKENTILTGSTKAIQWKSDFGTYFIFNIFIIRKVYTNE